MLLNIKLWKIEEGDLKQGESRLNVKVRNVKNVQMYMKYGTKDYKYVTLQ